MSERIVKLGIARDPDLMYFIRGGDAGVEMDMSRYLYFLDEDGDVTRVERAGVGAKSL
ncbi:MAG: hypothetical protein M4D80_17630 [Myxococcota bacterium]|nr:hypothetical protein [Deltaproteobacteria bacterium]MDQ3336985.1 hypothetical protein [Myxococcota bacterium]